MNDHDSLLSQEIQGAIHCVWVALYSSALSHEYLIEYAHLSHDKASLFLIFISQQGTSMKEWNLRKEIVGSA